MLAPDDGVLRGPAYRLSLLLGLYGFLVPVSVGVGARLFPLHFAAPMPDPRMLNAGLALLLCGLGLRAGGEIAGALTVVAVGLVAIAVASGLFIVGSRVFAARRAVPGGRDPWYTDAAQWHGLIAFGCLGLNALVLISAALAMLVPGLVGAPLRAEWHIVGLGFVTLLIFGEAVKLLPGFAGRPLRADALVWVTLALAGLAVILRIGPVLAPDIVQGAARSLVLVGSGVAGMLAIVALGLNLSGASRDQSH